GDDDERLRPGLETRVDHPVDHAAAENRVEVLRDGGTHPGTEPAGHQNGCEWGCRHGRLDAGGCWGARIRTWDRGTKTRCLTAWLRPTAPEYREGSAALGEEDEERREGEQRDDGDRHDLQDPERQGHEQDEQLRCSEDPRHLADRVRAARAAAE